MVAIHNERLAARLRDLLRSAQGLRREELSNASSATRRCAELTDPERLDRIVRLRSRICALVRDRICCAAGVVRIGVCCLRIPGVEGLAPRERRSDADELTERTCLAGHGDLEAARHDQHPFVKGDRRRLSRTTLRVVLVSERRDDVRTDLLSADQLAGRCILDHNDNKFLEFDRALPHRSNLLPRARYFLWQIEIS